MPPAYPAPSPHGKIPLMFDSKFSSRYIRIGDELRVSTPVRMASFAANPCSLLSISTMALASVVVMSSGNNKLKSVRVTPGVYEGVISPSFLDGRERRKSPTNCAGAW